MGFNSMTRDLNCTDFQATIGLSMYALGFSVVPLVTASFSEEFGRQPLYVVSGFGFMMMHLMVAEYVPWYCNAGLMANQKLHIISGRRTSRPFKLRESWEVHLVPRDQPWWAEQWQISGHHLSMSIRHVIVQC